MTTGDTPHINESENLQTRVVAAMSGGVDSSVAALLLHQQGYNVVGVSMQVWDYRQHGGCESRATCCSPDDFTDARRVADQIGIPYYVFDFEKYFRKEVIDNFIGKYQQGLTPNPCIDCNNRVKFRELRDRALAFGCSHVATGHFARITKDESGYHLLRGLDHNKDQSYFLYGMNQKEMASTLFPVGEYTKDEVRELAASAGLPTASKPESQDICFISGKVSDFVKKHSTSSTPGNVLDKEGNILGTHDGIEGFTVGQRKGLGVGGAESPLYVLEIDPITRNVTVGDRSDLEKEDFYVSEVSWASSEILRLLESDSNNPVRFRSMAQLRYRHTGVEVEVEIIDTDRVRCRFLSDWSTVSPGQAAVFYDLKNEEVLGGGRIDLSKQPGQLDQILN